MSERLAYTIAEAAEVLGVSASHLRRQVRLERIPTVHIGERRLIPAKALAEWVDARTVRPSA